MIHGFIDKTIVSVIQNKSKVLHSTWKYSFTDFSKKKRKTRRTEGVNPTSIEYAVKINKIIATTYNASKVQASINDIDTKDEYNETFKDYLEYYYNNEEFETDYFTYLFFIELTTSSDEANEPTYSYANIRIR